MADRQRLINRTLDAYDCKSVAGRGFQLRAYAILKEVHGVLLGVARSADSAICG